MTGSLRGKRDYVLHDQKRVGNSDCFDHQAPRIRNTTLGKDRGSYLTISVLATLLSKIGSLLLDTFLRDSSTTDLAGVVQ